MIAALAVAVPGMVWIRHTLGSVHRVDLAGALSAGSENFLLVGSDSRAGADPNDPDFGSMGNEVDVGGKRSDTIMLMRFVGGRAQLLSLPRDLYVKVAGSKRKSRINGAYAQGPDVLVRTVQESLSIPVHHYVEIDFQGFKRLVDALGGVSVWFDTPVRDANTGLAIASAGCHRLDGVQALQYSRSRHLQYFDGTRWRDDGTADLGRISRQQDFVRRSLIEAVEQASANPLTVGALVDAAVDNLSVDDALDDAGLVKLGRHLASATGGFDTFTFPANGRVIGGASVLVPDLAAAAPLIARFGGSGAEASGVIGGPGAPDGPSAIALLPDRIGRQTPTSTVGVVGDPTHRCS